MSQIQVKCPSCQRTLQLPATAAGRNGKCPACEQIFQVPQLPGGGFSPGTSGATPPPTGPPNDAAGQPNFGAAAGASDPFAAPVSPFGGGSSNPFQSPATVSNAPVSSTAGAVQSTDFGDVFNLAWGIFKSRWGSLVGPILLAGLLGIVASIGNNIIGAMIDLSVPGVGTLLTSITGAFISAAMYLSIARTSQAVCQGSNNAMDSLVPSLGAVGKLGLAGLLSSFLIFLPAIVVGVLIGVVGGAGPNEAMAGSLIGVLLLFTFGAFLVLGIVGWSSPFVFNEPNMGLIAGIKRTFSIFMANKITSLLIAMVNAVLMFAGVMLCGVGLLATIPLAAAVTAVGYLRATGQPVAPG